MLPSGIAQDDKTIWISRLLLIGSRRAAAEPVPHPCTPNAQTRRALGPRARSHQRLDLGVRDGMSRRKAILRSPSIPRVQKKSVLWSLQRCDLRIRPGGPEGRERGRTRTAYSTRTPLPLLSLYSGKWIAFMVAVEAERSRKHRLGTVVVRVKGRVTFFTARRTDTSVMIVCHGNTSAPDTGWRA